VNRLCGCGCGGTLTTQKKYLVGHNRRKLTEKQVAEIRRKFETGDYYQVELAKLYNISQNAMSKIVRGVSWLDMASDTTPRIKTVVHENGVITQSFKDSANRKQITTIDTKNEHVIEALLHLGWKQPEEYKNEDN